MCIRDSWYAVLRYDQDYIKQKESEAAGADTSDAKVTSNVAFNFQWNQSEVTSSGFNQIEVNKDYALDITINPDETPDEDQKNDKTVSYTHLIWTVVPATLTTAS